MLTLSAGLLPTQNGSLSMAKASVTRKVETVSVELTYDEARTLSALLYSAIGSSSRQTPGGVHWERLQGIGRAIRRGMGEAFVFEHTDSSMDEFVFRTNRITDCVSDSLGNQRLRQHMDCYSGGQQCLIPNHLDCPMKPTD